MPKEVNPAVIKKLNKLVTATKLKTAPKSEQTGAKQGPPLDPADPAFVRRSKSEKKEEPKPEPLPLTSGAIDKIVDLALNPSRETIRGFTNIDRIQGKLLPQLDIIDLVWQYIIEVAAYRLNTKEYERVYKQKMPKVPNLIDEFTYRTAQWQKSVMGKSLQSAIDLALAETEVRGGEEGDIFGGHGRDFED